MVDDKALGKHFDDLDANGFCVVENVLTAAEVSGIRKKLQLKAIVAVYPPISQAWTRMTQTFEYSIYWIWIRFSWS